MPAKKVVIALFLAYSFFTGFLGGIAVERIRFDQEREKIVWRLRKAIDDVHQAQMSCEKDAEAKKWPNRQP